LKTFFDKLFINTPNKITYILSSLLTMSVTTFFSSPFEIPYDTPLNMPIAASPYNNDDDKNNHDKKIQTFAKVEPEYEELDGYDWDDGTCTTDPSAWEYWVWEKHIEYNTGKAYYYSPHYDISTYDVPQREGPPEEYEEVVIKDSGATVWEKRYRKTAVFPHSETYYCCKITGEIRTEMPTRGYVQVVREYETIDHKGVRRNYTSIQFPKLPPLLFSN